MAKTSNCFTSSSLFKNNKSIGSFLKIKKCIYMLWNSKNVCDSRTCQYSGIEKTPKVAINFFCPTCQVILVFRKTTELKFWNVFELKGKNIYLRIKDIKLPLRNLIWAFQLNFLWANHEWVLKQNLNFQILKRILNGSLFFIEAI